MGILSRLLVRERVAAVEASDKDEALAASFGLLRSVPEVVDYAALVDALRARESAMPTGLGLGMGAPHIRHRAVVKPVASLIVLSQGVDYGAMDHVPVRAIFTSAMPEETQHAWLVALAELSRLVADARFREALYACRTADEVWETVKDK